ncbi:helix-turn-helix domain protein [Alkaliphilus metalliredigens QYMF]|uniref:Helix-turn-helix domain protein n=1 Tax=Alkaliphilus metalliredigens (strain QYMF) TaxID=293826 RepID=A6TNJ2_ALKMQ|nr:LexA family transcriptional regulator [Alkaliphilus metalliredigens]ABR47760.1 helix-turn-helix domain protein [Alkaliphilus metalliredigens QYMF]
MNRMAVKIKEARLKAKMSEKVLAKKCGLAESYIVQVESGKKVINENAAEKILEKLGAKVAFVTEQEEPVQKSQNSKETRVNKQEETFFNVQPTEQWSDALANIIKKFPVYQLDTNKITQYKELPILNKKVEGYTWDKILFVQSSNNEMQALRIKKDDIVMISLTNEIQNNNIYLFEIDNRKMLRQLRKEANNKVTLSTGNKGEIPIQTDVKQIKIIGKCVKVEFVL